MRRALSGLAGALWITSLGFDDGSYDVYVIAPDGSGLEQVTDTPTDESELDW